VKMSTDNDLIMTESVKYSLCSDVITSHFCRTVQESAGRVKQSTCSGEGLNSSRYVAAK